MHGFGSAASAGYYAGGGSVAAGSQSYYTDAVLDGEPPGTWWGELAAQHGLEGTVKERDLSRLLKDFEAPDGDRLGSLPRQYRTADERVADWEGKHPGALPEDVAAYRAHVENDSRTGRVAYDSTYSLQKSVTVLHLSFWRAELEAERNGDEARAERFHGLRTGIEDDLHAANSESMRWLQDNAMTRAGSHGRAGSAGRWVPVDGMVGASFFQHTTRGNKTEDVRSIDPQLHIHNVIFKNAEDTEGEIRALDSGDLRDRRKAWSAVGERVLAERMAARGFAMDVRPDGLTREVNGVPQEVCDLFSSRRQAITKALAPVVAAAEERLGRDLTNLELSRLSQKATLFTRAAKEHGGESFGEMLDRWQDQMRDEIGAGLVPLADRMAARAEATGPIREPVSFSPDAVIDAAIHEVATTEPAWNKAALMLAIDRHLPVTGLPASDAAEMVERLADLALEREDVAQVSGIDQRPAPVDLLGEGSSFVQPASMRYASPETLLAEDLIRQAAVTRGAHALDRAAVSAWLDENYRTITPDQRAVVEGIASSDARLAQLIAPPGTGKSFTAGALAGVVEALTGGEGRVIGLTTTEVASKVLQGDGITVASNLAAFAAAQDRIAAGRGIEGDTELRVGPKDVLLVDEASMVSTAHLDRVRAIADAAGAKVVPVGDPKQLAAVQAGGVLPLLDGRAETYTLSEVIRFDEEWEADASARLRDGDVTALDEYDRRGRIVDVETVEDAVREAGRRVAADLVEGKDSIGIAGTNELAARVATVVRDHLVEAGLVPEGGAHLPLDGTTAAVGDLVMTRQVDHGLDVANREKWTVEELREDGSMRVVNLAGEVRDLPADYVAEHVQSAYGATHHSTQGMTVDREVNVQDGRGDHASLLVPTTRGRERNTMVVATRPEPKADMDGPAHGEQPAPSGRAVLAGMLDRQTENVAARVRQERDQAWNDSMSTIAGKLDAVTELALQERLTWDLDRLAATGVLDEGAYARLGADQSRAHLASVVRAAEQSGADSFEALRDAVAGGELDSARSVAQVLASRIERAGLVADMPSRTAPERLPVHWQGHYDELQEAARARTRVLGAETSEQAPEWATRALGPVPEDPVARLEWEDRAGKVAAWRETMNWTDETVAVGSAGRRTDTEKRALFAEAWDALGRPEAGRATAGMTDGALRVRVAAWERERTWAPAHADAGWRQAELDAERARQDAVLARSRGEDELAGQLEQVAERRAIAARVGERVAGERAAWVAETAMTRAEAEEAAATLKDRGLEPGAEPDRVSAAEWLEADRAARAADDTHRVITEDDITADRPETVADMPANIPVEAGVDVATGAGEVSTDPRGDVRDEDATPVRQAEPRQLDVDDSGQAVDPAEAAAEESADEAPLIPPTADNPAELGEPHGDESALPLPDVEVERNEFDRTTSHEAERATGPGDAEDSWGSDVEPAPTPEATTVEPADPVVDESPAVEVDADGAVDQDAEPGPRDRSQDEMPLDPSAVKLSVLIADADAAARQIADRESEEAAHRSSEDQLTDWDIANPADDRADLSWEPAEVSDGGGFSGE